MNTEPDQQNTAMAQAVSNCWMRWALLAFGWANVGLGVVGIFVPGLPTTVFLLIALWAFSRSSMKFHAWLWNHPRLGPPIRDWHMHQVIPMKAKLLAVLTMAGSFVYIAGFVAVDWVLPLVMAGILVPVATYIITRNSQPPEEQIVVTTDDSVD